MSPGRRALLLALAPLVVGALRRRAEPAAAEDDEEDSDSSVDYLSLDQKKWTAQQVQEEIASNFTKSELFQTKLKRWCKWDEDKLLCHVRNILTHYCPTLIKAAPELVNRSVLIEKVTGFVKNTPTEDIWSRDGLISRHALKEKAGFALLQTDSHPKHKHHHKKQVAAEAEAASDDEEAEPKRSHAAKEAPKKQEQEKQEPVALAKDQAEVGESLQNPFPEVTGNKEFNDHVEEHCSDKVKVPFCHREAESNLLCWSLGKVLLEFVDIPTISLKMQDKLKMLHELNFRL